MRKNLIITVVATFCLILMLFSHVPTSSQYGAGEYNPWVDLNNDGKINILDIVPVAIAFGTSGKPFQGTAALEYDSGWIDITDKAGQDIIVEHGLGSMDVMVDITGKTTVDGGVHQKQIGGEDYVTEQRWNKTYGGTYYAMAYSVVQTGDGGYAMAGLIESYGAGGYDFWLVKTDASGNEQWNKTYGGGTGETAYSIIQTSDGGYALAGDTDSYGAGSIDFWLVKTDSSGNAQWNKTYGGTGIDEAYSVVQTADGGYAIAGYTMSFGAYDFWLVKTDANGNEQWNKTYARDSFATAYSVVQTGDGGYALAGYTSSFGGDFWLVKTDSDGNAQWNQTYGGTGYDEAHSVVQTGDGGYAIAGLTTLGTYTDSWLVRTDANGNMQWDKTYVATGESLVRSIVKMGDGGYAMAGIVQVSGGFDLWLIRTDSYGNQTWTREINRSFYEEAYSVIQTADGGCAITGYTGVTTCNFWLVKTDSNGNTDPQTGLFKYGLAWIYSTADTITLYRGTDDKCWNYVRVRIWKPKP